MRHIIFYLIAFSTIIWSCTSDGPDHGSSDRPNDPWVFRSVLDSIPRIVTVALDENMWVAYSGENGVIYKAWKGNVDFTGAVYTTVHGPQPMAVGNSYFVNEFPSPWIVIKQGKQVRPQLAYKGHKYSKGGVELMYDLEMPTGEKIRINERPEYVENESGLAGLERTFTPENIPEDSELVLESNISSIAFETMLSSSGDVNVFNTSPREFDGVKGIDAKCRVKLNETGSTSIKAYFTKPMIKNRYNVETGSFEEPEEESDESEIPEGYTLMAKSDCKVCHNPIQQTVGPSYMDIARKYDNSSENVSLLSGKVKNGGAGIWGVTAMTAHPDLPDEDITKMIEYIMSLDAESEAEIASIKSSETPADLKPVSADADAKFDDMIPGLLVRFKRSESDISSVEDLDFSQPDYETVASQIKVSTSDITWIEANYGFEYTGYLKVPKTTNYVFRLTSDDGSRFYLDGNLLIDHDGLHGNEPKDGEIALEEGLHPIKIEWFQAYGGIGLYLEWKSFDDAAFKLISSSSFLRNRDNQTPDKSAPAPSASKLPIVPGDGISLEEVHPSYDLTQARPDDFTPKVGGMDFMSDGRLVISTWDAAGSVYILDGVQSGEPEKITTKKIASGLAEPLGLSVVDDDIYVLQKQELTRLVDNNGDDVIDEYHTHANGWGVSANFHEFCFGLAYKDGYFYAALATAIDPGGASTRPQVPDRGKAIKISKEDGSVEFIAHGLRTPNGVGIGIDGEIFISDNQGDWLPSSKVVHVKEGAWYGSRSVDFEGTASLEEMKPVVWLPQNEIGNSPSTPLALNDGPYKGQMIHGEVTHGGIKRVFAEKVNGNYQGAVFRFMQGLEAGVNRLAWGPDGALYAGGIGSTGNWGHTGKLWYGVQRLKYNEKPAFEMLAVRARSNGIEIEMTEPLRPGEGWNSEDYMVKQWYYLPTENYGGPKMDLQDMTISSINISEDRKKIFLELNGMKEDHIIYVRLLTPFISDSGNELWTTEAWYTMNSIPNNNPGFTSDNVPASVPHNTLTEQEIKAGWKLLFDGKTTTGWRNYGKETIGSSWLIEDGTLMLDVVPRDDGWTHSLDGGDIITLDEYENFELNLEWKIADCGNSGIIFNVIESEDYGAIWETGPEMQVLDNSCHPDAKFPTHRAGDLYDLIACKYETVREAGQWNQARLIVNQGKVEHWLNGRKLVEYEMWTDEWNEMVANSKFKDMKGFGTGRKGHIALQDHDDRVWYRNIKVLEL